MSVDSAASESLKRPAPSVAPETPESSSKRSAGESNQGDSTTSQKPSSAEEEFRLIQNCIDNPLIVGQTWYILPTDWYNKWKQVKQNSTSSNINGSSNGNGNTAHEQDYNDTIGKINTQNLLDQDGQLNTDTNLYTFIDQQGWGMITEWYGLEGNAIARKVIPMSSTAKENDNKIELFPPEFVLRKVDSQASYDPPHIFSMSASTLYSDFLNKARNYAGLSTMDSSSTQPIRLWRLHTSSSDAKSTIDPALIGPEDSLVEQGLNVTGSSDLRDIQLDEKSNIIAIEQQDRLGNWLVEANNGSSSSSSAASSLNAPPFANNFYNNMESSYNNNNNNNNNNKKSFFNDNRLSADRPLTRSSSAATSSASRLTGLNNLGNTCYMNSALQCLANIPELRNYFLSGVYQDELNPDNPIGMHGQVAEAFGDLIENLSRGASGFAPRRFKQTIGRYHSTFLGYAQQDSQELIAFLLDGVHEDLNRIKNKPPTTSPDYKGGGDNELFELAKTTWSQYRSRNDSAIVDLFQGVYKSKLTCPDCQKISITFDPFMYVTLHFPPQKISRWLYVATQDPSKPCYKVHVQIPAERSMQQVKQHVGEKVGIDPKKLVAYEVYSNGLYKEFADIDQFSEISKNDVVVLYEVDYEYTQFFKPRYSLYSFNSSNSKTPKPLNDDQIIVPVLHEINSNNKKFAKNNNRGYGFNTSPSTSFGIPFMISLTPQEASDPKAIHEKIVKQYIRVANDPTRLVEEEYEYETLQEDEKEQVQEQEKQEESDQMQESQEVVNGGPASEMSVDHETEQNSLSVSSASSSSSPRKARKTSLFEINVQNPSQRTRSITSKPETYLDFKSLSDLYNEEPTVTTTTTSATSTSDHVLRPQFNSNDDYDDLYENGTKDTTKNDGPDNDDGEKQKQNDDQQQNDMQVDNNDSTTPEPRRLVDSGSVIKCVWNAAAATAFFGEQHDGKFEEYVEIPPKEQQEQQNVNGKSKRTNETVTLDSLWDLFTHEDVLGDENAWYCSDCKDFKGMATKKLDLWTVPDILVVHLKRFHSATSKIGDYVDFPIEGLDLRDKVQGHQTLQRLADQFPDNQEYQDAITDESMIYDLCGVVNHMGGTGGGHYTAYCLNSDDEKWYEFDDSRVSPVRNRDSIKTSSAYVLFYKRRTSKPIGGKTNEIVNSAMNSQTASRVNSQPDSRPDSPMVIDDKKSSDTNGNSLTRESLRASNLDNGETNGFDDSGNISDDGAEVGSNRSDWSTKNEPASRIYSNNTSTLDTSSFYEPVTLTTEIHPSNDDNIWHDEQMASPDQSKDDW